MHIDVLTVGVGVVSFGIFLLIHFIAFRWIRPEELLKSLLATVLLIALLPVVLMGVLFANKAMEAPVQAWVCASVLALVITVLLCFVYVLCVFGPYETSVRMRLVREIDGAGPGGISEENYSRRYNNETILNVRLRRLLGSGDIIEKDGHYRSGSTRNFFFLFDAIAGVLKKWIG